MKKNDVLPSGFTEAFAGLKNWQAQNDIVLQGVTRMLSLSRYDVICGNWIACEDSTSLMIRREGYGFRLLMIDNTHCYKTIKRDVPLFFSGRRLLIEDDAAGTPGGEVTFDQTTGLLRVGSYGLFRSEEELLREELQHEMDFNLRNTDEEVF